jgi:hypothetical protein
LSRLIASAIAVLAFSACDEAQMQGLSFAPGGGAQGIRTLAVLDNAIRVAGPDGFCVDRRASRQASGFAVLVGCAVISATPSMPRHSGLLTVQIGAADTASVTGSEPALEGLLRTAQGAAMLSVSNRAQTVTSVSTIARAGLVVVHFTDSGARGDSALQTDEWRAFFDLRGRLVTISVRGLTREPLTSQTGLQLVQSFVAAMQAANPGNVQSNS